MAELKNCISVINTKSDSFSVYITTNLNNNLYSDKYNLESYLSIEDIRNNYLKFNFYELKMLIDELIKSISSIEKNRDEIVKTSNTNSYSFVRNMNNEFQSNSISVSFNLITSNNRPVLLCSMILNNARDNKAIKLFENENFVKLKILTDELKAIMTNFHVLHSNNVLLAKINSINNGIVVEEDHKVNIDNTISKNVTVDYKKEEDEYPDLKVDTNSNIPKSSDIKPNPKIPQAVTEAPVVAPQNHAMLNDLNGLDGFENDSLEPVPDIPNVNKVRSNDSDSDAEIFIPY